VAAGGGSQAEMDGLTAAASAFKSPELGGDLEGKICAKPIKSKSTLFFSLFVFVATLKFKLPIAFCCCIHSVFLISSMQQ
jgi:hypothetical protein